MKAPPCQFNEIVGKIKMLNMEVRTSLSVEELAERLKEFFGTGRSRTGAERGMSRPDDLHGRRGPCDGRLLRRGGKTLLKIVTSGWAVPVKKFIDKLP